MTDVHAGRIRVSITCTRSDCTWHLDRDVTVITPADVDPVPAGKEAIRWEIRRLNWRHYWHTFAKHQWDGS